MIIVYTKNRVVYQCPLAKKGKCELLKITRTAMDLARHMVWFPPSAEDHRLWIESRGLDRKDLVADPTPLADILEKEARFGDTLGLRIGK